MRQRKTQLKFRSHLTPKPRTSRCKLNLNLKLMIIVKILFPLSSFNFNVGRFSSCLLFPEASLSSQFSISQGSCLPCFRCRGHHLPHRQQKPLFPWLSTAVPFSWSSPRSRCYPRYYPEYGSWGRLAVPLAIELALVHADHQMLTRRWAWCQAWAGGIDSQRHASQILRWPCTLDRLGPSFRPACASLRMAFSRWRVQV